MKTTSEETKLVQSESEKQVRVVTLEMSDDSFVRLNALWKSVGYKDLSKFLTDAIQIYEVILEERARGGKVGILNKSEEVTAILAVPDHRAKGFGR